MGFFAPSVKLLGNLASRLRQILAYHLLQISAMDSFDISECKKLARGCAHDSVMLKLGAVAVHSD
jgi:hypothetical protein